MSHINPNTPNDFPLVLTKDTGWYGGHSGFYEQLGGLLQLPPYQARVFKPKQNFARKVTGKLIGKFNSIRAGMPYRNAHTCSVELEFFLRMRFLKEKFSCVLNMDDHWTLLHYWDRAPRSLVGVIHIPTSQWSIDEAIDRFETCRKLRSAVALWEQEIPALEQLVGPGRVAFVPHGIDTEFFQPGIKPRKKMSFLSCGQYLRDFDMLKSVFLGISGHNHSRNDNHVEFCP